MEWDGLRNQAIALIDNRPTLNERNRDITTVWDTAELWTVELKKFHCFRPDVTPAQPSVAFFQSLNVVSVLKRKSDVTHYLDEDK